MKKLIRALARNTKRKQEAGDIFILAMIFMLAGIVVLIPLLGIMATSLKSETSFDRKSDALYAADAGIEDAMWQIKYDRLKGTISDYDQYCFKSSDNVTPKSWTYNLPQQINNKDVSVTITNIWVPDISPIPSSSTAKTIAESEKLIVTGGLYGTTGYKIIITFTPDPGNDLKISEIGVWLPPGLSFKTGSSNLEASGKPYTKTPAASAYKGGQKITWTYSTPLAYTSFPGVNTADSPMTATITFNFTPSVTTTLTSSVNSGATSIQVASTGDFSVPGELAIPNEPAPVTYTGITATSFTGIPSTGSGSISVSHTSGTSVSSTASPDALSWVNTTGVSGLSYSWDSEVRVFGISSTSKKADGSDDTTIQSYVAKSELKKMNKAMNGDYFATGGSLMINKDKDSSGIREFKQDSEATVSSPTLVVATPTPIYADNGVPSDGNVAAVYMYWASWYRTGTGGSGRMSELFADDASGFTNFTNGGDWRTYDSTYFMGHYSGGADSTKMLTKSSSIDLSAYSGSSYITTLTWEQWAYNKAYVPPLDPDPCDDFTNWTKAASSVWTISSGKFKGAATSGTDTNLTLTNSFDLSGCTANSVQIKWTQAKSGTLVTGDNLSLYLSNDGGTTWTFQTNAIQGPSTYPSSFSYTVPSQYFTGNVKIKLTLTGFSSTKYCTVDDIKVTLPSAATYSSSDAIKFAISKDGGTNWSSYTTAVTGDKIGTSAYDAKTVYQYNIPRDYLTSLFKVKLYIEGFASPGKYFGIDNIRICKLQPKEGITFKIDSTSSGSNYQQVYFNSSGNPATGSSELTATKTQALITYTFNSSASPTPRGFAYTCFRDVTDLVRAYAEQPSGVETNFNGHGKYKVTGDLGDTGTDTGWYQQAHAGWSLVLIYSSADTLGHQLYLYDDFICSGYTDDEGGSGINVDFDKDGQPGGTISGFVVPDPIKDENGTIIEKNAARLSVFVSEGDSVYGLDYLEIKGTLASTYTKLWDGTTTTGSYPNNKASPLNTWNGQSMVLGNADGVDIDTLGIDPTASPPQYITWSSNILAAKDTSASINLVTHKDTIFLVYLIISFRSETTTGGSLSYLIRG